MDTKVIDAIRRRVAEEAYARKLGLTLRKVEPGYALVEMVLNDDMGNIFDMAHGGAIFSLIDEAFETAGQTDGTIAVALNVNVTYVSSPEPESRLRAEARQVSLTKKTAGYMIRVTDQEGRLIATCQALAYRTGKPIPFL